MVRTDGSEPRERRRRWSLSGRHYTRDGIIVTFALAAGAYEIVIGGGRPSVLTFLTGLLLSPLVLRVDEARRRDDDPGKGSG